MISIAGGITLTQCSTPCGGCHRFSAIGPSGSNIFVHSATSRRNDSPSFEEIDILWITAGLGCDGDTIAVTAATQPTLEEILLGAFPGIPKINFHSPFLSYENGADFLRRFHFAAENRPSVVGICIGCAMPGFPDKFVPFMNQPPGSILSTTAVMTYGKTIRALRNFTQASLNKEPERRQPKILST